MFQVNYREINDLHKQMLRTSRKVEGLAAGAGFEPLVEGERLIPRRLGAIEERSLQVGQGSIQLWQIVKQP